MCLHVISLLSLAFLLCSMQPADSSQPSVFYVLQ